MGGDGFVAVAVGVGIFEGLGLRGRELDPAGLADDGGVDFEGASEGLGAGQQALLQIDEGQAAAGAGWGAQLGVAGELFGERELEVVAAELVGDGAFRLADGLLGVVALAAGAAATSPLISAPARPWSTSPSSRRDMPAANATFTPPVRKIDTDSSMIILSISISISSFSTWF